MLATLSDGGDYDTLVAALTAMEPPENPLALVPEGNLKALFAELRFRNVDMFYGDLTYWWIPPGPEGLQPRVMMRRGFPSPLEYSSMLSADHGREPVAAEGGQ